jgi:hypothetical protein
LLGDSNVSWCMDDSTEGDWDNAGQHHQFEHFEKFEVFVWKVCVETNWILLNEWYNFAKAISLYSTSCKRNIYMHAVVLSQQRATAKNVSLQKLHKHRTIRRQFFRTTP